MKPFEVVLIVCSFLFLGSCSKESNPITPIESSDYLGSIGTQRSYMTVERWLISNSNLPYYSVPDSLKSKLSITSSQLDSGVCFISRYTESVSPISDDFYGSWHLTSPRTVYREINGIGTQYSLAYEIQALESGTTYSLTNIQIGQNIFRDTVDAVMTVLPTSDMVIAPSVPYIKKHLELGLSWTRYEWIDTSATHMRIKTIAQVESMEKVSVPSGTYTAFRIHITTYHYNPDYNFDNGYEYFVPDIGLVLKESNMVVYQWNSQTNTTISFRQIIRQELLAVNFIK